MTDPRADEVGRGRARSSVIEIIAADYPQWRVGFEPGCEGHGRWRAARGGVTVTATCTAALLTALEESELDRLRSEYLGRWRVWRTPRYWMATALVTGVEPTLMEETATCLEARMRDPGPWGGIPCQSALR